MKKLSEIKLNDFYEMDEMEMRNIIGGSGSGDDGSGSGSGGSGSGSGSGGSGSGTYPCPSGENYYTGKCKNGKEFALCALDIKSAEISADAFCKSW